MDNISYTKNNNTKNNKKICYNKGEKIIIIYLLVISLMLIFLAQLFIHDIIDTEENIILDNIDTIKVTEDTADESTEWRKLKELAIFQNSYFDGQSKIAPGLQATYNFSVENESNSNFEYLMNFQEENPYNINMVYRLKKNGNYIVGSEDEWVKPEILSQTGMKLKSLQKDRYTLEWKWEDTEYDTSIGIIQEAYYRIFIEVKSKQANK